MELMTGVESDDVVAPGTERLAAMAVIGPEQWERIKDVFSQALDLPPPSREAFLHATCEDDSLVLNEVRRLLDHHDESTGYLDPAFFRPALDGLRTTFASGETVNERFRIIRFIGKGGMGEVYEAADEAIGGVRVALKTIRSGMEIDDRLQAQFRREVQMARRITHPNVCRIHDLFQCRFDDPILGVPQAVLFLTMELLEGESLAELLATQGAMPLPEVLPIIRDVGGALEAAHLAGVVHLDLKSSNVMLVKSPSGSKKAVLTDFGLSSSAVAGGDAESLYEVAGTPAYMAPEQIRRGAVDARTDLYSLGVVIYEMVTGKRPFAECSTFTAVGRRAGQRPAPPRTIVPDLDPRWETAILRCLEVSPDDRYPSAAALLADLEGSGEKRTSRRLFVGLTTLATASTLVLAYRGMVHPSASIRSVAVMPLRNLSGDKELDYFAAGLTDELPQMLSRIRGLKIIASNSARKFKGNLDLKSIAKQLKVEALLMGGIRRQGGRVSVTAQLVAVEDGVWLWSGNFDESDQDLARVRVNFALAIAGALQPRLSPTQLAGAGGPQSNNSEAYRLYLMGRFQASYRTGEGLKRSIDDYLQSIALEPRFALSHAALADSYNILSGQEGCPPEIYFPMAESAAQRALDLDPRLGEAHVSLASVCQRFRWDWAGAEQHFRTALELNPGLAVAHHWYAGFLSNLCRHDEALREIQTASELDPLSPSINTAYAVFLYRARRYDDAIARFQQARTAFPGYTAAVYQLGEVFRRKGMWREAIDTFQKAVEVGGANLATTALLGETLALSGRVSEAQAIAQQLESELGSRHFSAANIAYVYRGLGDRDRAFYWFNEAFRRREAALMILKTDPANDALRPDPRFSKLLEGLRL